MPKDVAVFSRFIGRLGPGFGWIALRNQTGIAGGWIAPIRAFVVSQTS